MSGGFARGNYHYWLSRCFWGAAADKVKTVWLRLDHFKHYPVWLCAPVAQWIRVLASEAKGRGFESLRARQLSSIRFLFFSSHCGPALKVRVLRAQAGYALFQASGLPGARVRPDF